MAGIFIIAAGGSIAAVGALAISRAASGFLEAGAFVLALFLATITIGVVAAFTVSALFDRSDERKAYRGRRFKKRRWGNGVELCGSCRGTMDQIGDIWVCPACDLAPAEV